MSLMLGSINRCHNCAWALPGSANLPAFCPTCSAPLLLQGRYRILVRIGGGGRGVVYKAENQGRSQRIYARIMAVKEINPSLLQDPGERESAISEFDKEAELLSGLDHPNLPCVYDYFAEKSRPDDIERLFLVMEFIEGKSLEILLKPVHTHFPEERVSGWALQLCDVLEYLHSQKPKPIIFRDMKPGNVMVTSNNTIKLIDFGIARLFDPAKNTDTIYMGTPGYAPPEQFGGQGGTDQRSDIFALGATLFHLATGVDPTEAGQVFRRKHAIEFNSRLSKRLDDAIYKSTRENKEDRFRSAAEMRAALLGEMIVSEEPQAHSADVFNLRAWRDGRTSIVLSWSLPANVYRVYVRRSCTRPPRINRDLEGQLIPVETNTPGQVVDSQAPRQACFYTVFCEYMVSPDRYRTSKGSSIQVDAL